MKKTDMEDLIALLEEWADECRDSSPVKWDVAQLVLGDLQEALYHPESDQ